MPDQTPGRLILFTMFTLLTVLTVFNDVYIRETYIYARTYKSPFYACFWGYICFSRVKEIKNTVNTVNTANRVLKSLYFKGFRRYQFG